MAASAQLGLFASTAALTISLGSLGNGSGRQSTMVSNTSGRHLAAKISAKIRCGTTPTAGSTIDLFLLRGNSDASYRTDGAGASDAALTVNNATPLASIVVPATTSDTDYYVDVDTALLGPLGPEWGIAVKNNSGVALNATGGNHVIGYEYYDPEAQ